MKSNPEAIEIYTYSRNELKNLEETKKENKNALHKYKVRLNNMKKMRMGNDDSIDTLLFKILDDAKIKKQSFHGGAMNGVYCRRFSDNVNTTVCCPSDIERSLCRSIHNQY